MMISSQSGDTISDHLSEILSMRIHQVSSQANDLEKSIAIMTDLARADKSNAVADVKRHLFIHEMWMHLYPLLEFVRRLHASKDFKVNESVRVHQAVAMSTIRVCKHLEKEILVS